MSELEVGRVYRVDDIPTEPIDPDQVREGEPRAGVVSLGTFGDVEVGVWEHTPGVSTDVEEDEVFVVLSGRESIEFVNSDLPGIQLEPGAVIRVETGIKTVWRVEETIRKVWVA